jgi:hypothetical protein
MADVAGSYELKGVAPVEEWRGRVEALGVQIHTRDKELAKQRAAVKKKRNIAVGAAVAAGIGAVVAGIGAGVADVGGGFARLWPVGFVLAMGGAFAANLLFKPPPGDFIGEERAIFVRELLALLADIAPKGPLVLAAQLDARRGMPPAELPSGSDNALVSQEKKEAWLSGSFAAIPGLRLAWNVTEWRTVKLARKTVVRRRTKIKIKAKFALATRLAVRLDVDRTLFALKPVANPQRAQDGDSSVDVRQRPSGWSLRGQRDLVQKTQLWSADVVSSLDLLREQGKGEFFGQPAAALINLMKLCEGRLLPATLPAPAKAGTP